MLMLMSNGGNPLGLTPSASFFISQQLDERWTIGFGSYGDFGLAENYDNDWAGRHYLQNASIVGLSLVPSAAYKLNEQWSLGIGVKAMYAMLESQAAINRAPLGLLDRSDGLVLRSLRHRAQVAQHLVNSTGVHARPRS